MDKNSIVETGIETFTNQWNEVRRENGISQLVPNRGYKFTRLIDGQGTTVAFISNTSGEIFKPASNIARSVGSRACIVTSDGSYNPSALSECVSEDFTGIQHYKRGRKLGQTAEALARDVIATEIVSEIVGEIDGGVEEFNSQTAGYYDLITNSNKS